MSSQNTVLGVLAGVALGAVAGILLAPEKGDKTRKKIVEKAKDTKADITDNLDVTLEELSKKYDELKLASETLVKKGKEKLEKVQEEIAS